MRDGKMIRLIGEKWLTGIGDQDHIHREIRKKVSEKVPPGQVLQSFVRVADFPAHWHMAQEEIGRFLDFPETELRVLVNILLIKQGHG
jgi:hypothetical protein